MLGAVSQIAQVLLLRELLMVFHGNELSIGLILASWLLWVGVGSHLGGHFIEGIGRPRRLLLVTTAALVVMLPVTILLVRGLRGFFDLLPGAYLSLADMALSCLTLMAPVCLLLGAAFVVLSRAWREGDGVEDTSGAEKTYIGEAAGSMLGGILFTFFLVHQLNSIQSGVLAGGLMFAAVLSLRPGAGWAPGRFRSRMPILVVGILVIITLAFPLMDRVDDWAHGVQWRQFSPEYQLVDVQQSRYGAITVARREDQYSFFQSGHLVFSTAGPETLVPGFEEQDAVNFAHLAMVQHENPERILLIGGGLRGLLREVLEHPVQRVDYVELDEVLTGAALPYVSRGTREALDDPRVNLIHADGRLFVKTAGETYDVIIVDHPDPYTAELNRYYTEEFFREASDLLRAGGVFVTGVTSTPDLRGTAIANRNTAVYHTLGRVFDHVLLAGERFMLYFASDAPEQVSVDARLLYERYGARGIDVEGFSPGRFFTILEETQLARVNWVVRNHGRSPDAHLEGPGAVPAFPGTVERLQEMEAGLAPVSERYFINSDMRPIAYYYTLVFWEDLTRDVRAYSLQNLLRVQSWWILPLALIPLLTALGLRSMPGRAWRRRSVGFAVLFTVLTTGLSTMSLQIALLFSFQSIYGFVYELVGLITAVFMAGLALGAFFTHRHVVDKVNLRLLALVQLFMALLAVLIALVLPAVAGVGAPAIVLVLLFTVTFVAGLINGVDFPLAVACYMSLRQRVDRSTGTVYGVELFGACVGAVAASVLVAPVLGITACCMLAAVASATACVVLMVSGGGEKLHVTGAVSDG